MARFLKKDAIQMSTLYDIIQAKIEAKQNDAELALSQVDPNEFNVIFKHRALKHNKMFTDA